MNNSICPMCKHCEKMETDENGDKWFWCQWDHMWVCYENAFSDLECDVYEQELDDHKTEESSA